MAGAPTDKIKGALKNLFGSKKSKQSNAEQESLPPSAPADDGTAPTSADNGAAGSTLPPNPPAEVSADSALKVLPLTAEPAAPATVPDATSTSTEAGVSSHRAAAANPDITVTPSSAVTEKPADKDVLPLTADTEGAGNVSAAETSTTDGTPATATSEAKEGEMSATSGPLEDHPAL